jgi:hypothetical protein
MHFESYITRTPNGSMPVNVSHDFRYFAGVTWAVTQDAGVCESLAGRRFPGQLGARRQRLWIQLNLSGRAE